MTRDANDSPYHTVATAAERMHVGQDTIRDAIKDGRLMAKRIGKGERAPFRIREDALDEWFESWADA
jgi:excisionase family DNA binding protein